MDRSRKCPNCGNTIAYSNYVHWWRANKAQSKCVKCMATQIGKHNKGIVRSSEFRLQKRLEAIGRKHTEATKLKLRQFRAERFLELGVGTNTDKGAVQYFNALNKQGNSIETNKYFRELGYFADGYDKGKHIWYEYDTIYHSERRQQEKDAIRQNRIVEHFKALGKPLNDFVRIKSWQSFMALA